MKRATRNKVKLMLDSGAFTAWTQGKPINIDEYISYIKANERLIDTYFNLDVIPGKPGEPRTPDIVEASAKASYKNLIKMKKAGLSPIPVFHYGESFSWLERMLDDGETYIGFGGASWADTADIIPWFNKIFTRITDKEGKPFIKAHGLGLASFSLIKRYPWYSCDATSWALMAAYGSIYVPIYRNGKFDYSQAPVKITISTVDRKGGKTPPDHYLRLGQMTQKLVDAFLQSLDPPLTPEMVAEDYIERARAVVAFMMRFQNAIGEVRFRERGFSFDQK